MGLIWERILRFLKTLGVSKISVNICRTIVVVLRIFAMSAAFRLGSGAARIQAYLATLNPGGAPSSLVQVDGPVHGLSAGGL